MSGHLLSGMHDPKQYKLARGCFSNLVLMGWLWELNNRVHLMENCDELC